MIRKVSKAKNHLKIVIFLKLHFTVQIVYTVSTNLDVPFYAPLIFYQAN